MLLRLAGSAFWLAADSGTWRILRREPGRRTPTTLVGTYTSARHAEQGARAKGLPKEVVRELGELAAVGERADAMGDEVPDDDCA